ncbi:MAG: hypothetical protein NTW60_01245 [Candidatus Wolfebacteria bacterium]|nr:hypothetical protein [Candidatus Wolfebacteria bacterium]
MAGRRRRSVFYAFFYFAIQFLADGRDEMPDIKKLWQNLMTSKTPIAKREKIIRMPMGKDERFNVFRKITADKEIARRVDYR